MGKLTSNKRGILDMYRLKLAVNPDWSVAWVY
jgi:hypothetical protein